MVRLVVHSETTAEFAVQDSVSFATQRSVRLSIIREAISVGIFVDSIGAYGRGITRGILAYQRYRGWHISMMRTWMFQPLTYIEDWVGHGLIAMVPDEVISARLSQLGKPVVCVSSILPQPHHRSVVADDVAVGEMAAAHFLDRGFRNFIFHGHGATEADPLFIVDRCAGFTHRVAAAGFTVHRSIQDADLAAVLQTVPLPAAVFAANDELGLRAISIADQLGLRVPEQIAVLGVDDDDLLVESGSVSLSSIALPTTKIGFEAAAMLDAELNGTFTGSSRLALPPIGVVTRKSSDITAIDDPDLMAALAFIREHASEPIDVSAVVEAVPLSRRVLERRFQKHLHRSALEEIQRVKIDRACRLLIDTDLSISEVARASGFLGRSRFHAVFAKAKGCSPKEFRLIHQQTRPKS